MAFNETKMFLDLSNSGNNRLFVKFCPFNYEWLFHKKTERFVRDK